MPKFQCQVCNKVVESEYIPEGWFVRELNGVEIFFCSWECTLPYRQDDATFVRKLSLLLLDDSAEPPTRRRN